MRSYDVIILGGGIAGAFLGRQLNLARPDLSVLLVEAASKIDNLKVGESTVEVAASYMIRKLHLGTYLYQHQLPKNGLRFFFDSPEKNLPLTRMSEIGSDHFPYHPSFQLERAALERDVLAMNRAAGVDVQLGARVVDLRIDGASGHRVVYEQQGERREARCRFLCDASGRRHLIARALGQPIHKETRLNTGAAWGRYRHIAGLDAVTDPAFRGRVRHTSRHLSTNHMMYDGYWIWFIPLSGDLMSVGVVFDKDRISNGPRTREQLEAFLQEHRACRDLMQGAVFEDFQSYAHLPYTTETFFSEDRFALTGEAGAFTDPFYSPGSDFIATSNEFITELILADLAGDDAAFREKVQAYNAYYKFKYESTLLLYTKMYPVFGSYEIFRLKYLLDFNNYYNLVLWPFLAGRLTSVEWIREELKFTGLVLRALTSMGDHFSRMGDTLRDRGEYFAQNEGRWANGLNGVAQLQERIGGPLDPAARQAEVDKAYGSVFAAVLERMAGEPGLSHRARVLSELGLPQVLVFKDINEQTAGRFLDRIARRISRDLKQEFPALEQVVLGRAGAGISVVGPPEGSDAHGACVARVQELWDAKGESLAHVML